jgi:pyruvate/2-oxoglutarate dehydrogenase complex dihydrolipoamide acyltransferase (E2) component
VRTNGKRSRFRSPGVRRLLRQNSLDPSGVEGTGFRGRITRSDVLAAAANRWNDPLWDSAEAPAENGATAPVPALPAPTANGPTPVQPVAQITPPSPAASPPTPEMAPVAYAARPAQPAPLTDGRPQAAVAEAPSHIPVEAPRPVAAAAAHEAQPAPVSWSDITEDRTLEFTPQRAEAAELLAASLTTAAHGFCAIEVDFQRLERVRESQRDRWLAEEGFGLTYLPFVARAVIDALGEFPRLNASVGTAELVLRHKVNLGIGVDADADGFVVPVVRDAETKRLRGIAREADDLATRARARLVTAEERSDSTFTIAEPSQFGTLLSIPIIHQPEAAILAIDAIRRRPVIVRTPDGSDGFTVHALGVLGLSFDQRVIEPSYASAFLDRVRRVLETRDWEIEL